MLDALRTWSARRWWVAAAASVLTALVVALPTAMIPTPVFGREIPTTWWAWPTLALTAVFGGLLVASYVREPGTVPAAGGGLDRRGTVGGLLSFFAVGCPVCNKLVLLALGTSGAVTWFAPLQPWLAAGSLVLLAVALAWRVRALLARPPAPGPGQSRPGTALG